MNTVKNFIKLSFKNIRRHPVKNFLIGIVIFLASILFLFNGSLKENAESAWKDYFSRTFTGDYHITSYQGLERDYTLPSFTLPGKMISSQIIDYLNKNHVVYSKRIKIGAAVYDDKKSEFKGSLPALIGIDWEKELALLSNLKIVSGRFDPDLPNGILVWKEYADSLKWKAGDEITLYMKDTEKNTYPYSFRVMGIVNHQEGASLEGKGVIQMFPALFVSYQYLALQLGIEDNQAVEIAVWDKEGKYEKDLKKLAEENSLQYFQGTQGYGIVFGIVELLGFFGSSIAALILVILVVATLNLNMMGFFERRKEIGSLVAMGARPFWLVGLLLMEMVVFATLVFALACGFYFILTQTGGKGIDFGEMAVFFAGKKFTAGFELQSVVNGYLTILIVSFISSIYPIYLTTKINPVDVFREAEI